MEDVVVQSHFERMKDGTEILSHFIVTLDGNEYKIDDIEGLGTFIKEWL